MRNSCVYVNEKVILILWFHPIKTDCLANKLRFILQKRFRDDVNYNKAHFPNKWAFHQRQIWYHFWMAKLFCTKKADFVYILCNLFNHKEKERKEKKKKKLLCLRQNSLTWNRISVISLAQVFFLLKASLCFFFCLFE